MNLFRHYNTHKKSIKGCRALTNKISLGFKLYESTNHGDIQTCTNNRHDCLFTTIRGG